MLSPALLNPFAAPAQAPVAAAPAAQAANAAGHAPHPFARALDQASQPRPAVGDQAHAAAHPTHGGMAPANPAAANQPADEAQPADAAKDPADAKAAGTGDASGDDTPAAPGTAHAAGKDLATPLPTPAAPTQALAAAWAADQAGSVAAARGGSVSDSLSTAARASAAARSAAARAGGLAATTPDSGAAPASFQAALQAAGTSAAKVAAYAPASDTPAAHTDTDGGVPDATVGTLGAPALPAATALAAPAEAHLAAHPGSAEFASQLGAQLSTFVRDGVQHARLELNPAEMGPLTVQIQIDGATAQVHLAANHAQTRHALEQAMPTLAGNLRDAGFTLSGGGVSEQPRQAPQPAGQAGAGGAGGRAGASAEGSPALAVAAATLRQRGVVDLVA